MKIPIGMKGIWETPLPVSYVFLLLDTPNQIGEVLQENCIISAKIILSFLVNDSEPFSHIIFNLGQRQNSYNADGSSDPCSWLGNA